MTHDGNAERRTILLTEIEARAHLGGISRAAMSRLRNRGDLATVQIGRRVLFRLCDLDEYVERRLEASPMKGER